MPLHVLAPYVATPDDVVERMLQLAEVGGDDHVLDLGCGDGRVVIAAAALCGARGSGVDIEPYWIEQSRQRAEAAGVADRVEFSVHDALEYPLAHASVVFVYLVHWSTQMMAVRLRAQLRPGARVVSLSFPVVDWAPDRVERFVDGEGVARTLFLWRQA